MFDSAPDPAILAKNRIFRRATSVIYYSLDKAKTLYSVFMDNQQASPEWRKETLHAMKERLNEALCQIKILEMEFNKIDETPSPTIPTTKPNM